MKVAAYLRVSTDKQAEHGLGLDVQREVIKTWAKTHKHRVALWTADEGVSGSNGIDGRQGLPEALGALKARMVEGLVVYRLDRLARDLVLQEQLLAELRRMGSAVFSTAAGEQDYLQDDPRDPSRRLIRQILGAVNEYERQMIRLRLQAGQQRKRERGGRYAGQPPYGYSAHDRELVPNGAEQRTLARMVELKADGLSLRAIAERLTDEGHEPRTGQVWYPYVISQILARQPPPRRKRR